MNTPVSFSKIINLTIKILSEKSLDSYYCDQHPYFEGTELLFNKLAVEIISRLNQELDSAELEESEDFKGFLDHNWSNILYYESNLEKEKNVLIKTQKAFENEINQLNCEKEEFKNLIEETKIKKLQNAKDLLDHRNTLTFIKNKINDKNNEITILKNSDTLKNKSPYIERITSLKEDIKKLNSDYNKKEESIVLQQTKIEKTEAELIKAFSDLKLDLEAKKITIHEELEKIKEKLKSFDKDKIKFNREEEKKNYEEMSIFLDFKTNAVGAVADGEYSDIRFEKSKFFLKVFKNYSIDVSLDRIIKSLKEFLKSKINSYTKAMIPHDEDPFTVRSARHEFKIDPFCISKEDEIIVMLFALKRSLKKDNFIKTDNNIYYLDIGNGIMSKFLVRENTDNIKKDLCFIYDDTMLYKVSHKISEVSYMPRYRDSIYRNINAGLYLITSDLIFDIFFEKYLFLHS